ncbi:MAG: aspartate carbamoyltransferase regulatory subunit [Candidatus Aenigmarchaeota archaeon]|nr:aspartate carbamoyltransferase regulatory subunit [Candidatus Aenigmarchaeota archaeon]
MKELKVSAIRDGTVIDHVPGDVVFKVVDVLNLEKSSETVMVAANLKSSRIGQKGIIKVSGKILTKEEVDKIALLAPNATLNIIRDYKVAEKASLSVPDVLINVIKCNNPNCITNNDSVKTKFTVVSKDNIRVRCHYCERYIDKEDIKVL